MRKTTIKAIAIAILLVPAIAHATAVTGTVTDPNGLAYSGGTLVITLTSPGGVTPNITATGAPVSNPGSTITLDLNGKFSVTLQDNTTITPASTQWQFTVTCGSGCVNPGLGKGPQQFTVKVTISGVSQDISATLQAAAPALSNVTGGGGLPSGCSPSGNSLGTCQPTIDVVPLTLKDFGGGTSDLLDLGTGGALCKVDSAGNLTCAGNAQFGANGPGTWTVGGNTVNQIVLQSASAGSAPTISVAGIDTNQALTVSGKGTGNLNLNGTNASVTPAGALTVTSCTGCGGTVSTWFQWGINPNASFNFAGTANHIELWAFYVHGSLTYSKFAIQVATSDGANSYDIGIYPYSSGATCNLRKHIGATTMGTTGYVEFGLSGGGTDTLTDGWWVFATTGPATTALLKDDGTNQFPQPFQAVNAGAGSDITGGGTTLPASITCPTQTFNASAGTSAAVWLTLHN